MSFGKRLLAARRKKGFSQDEIAKKLNTKTPVIGRYERDEAKPSIEVAARLASLLEVSLDYLVGNSDIKVNADMPRRALELQRLSEDDKNTALKLLDAFLEQLKPNRLINNSAMKNIFTLALFCLAISAFAQDYTKIKPDSVSLDYGYRIYDARIWRFASVDPKAAQNSTYDFEDVIEGSTKKTSFDDVLNKYSLQLTIPENFSEVSVKNNPDIKYQYALKHDSLDFEIRFLVTDINTALDLPDDKRSLSQFMSIVLNASGETLSKIPKIDQLQGALAEQEYNANWIATSSFFPKSKFSEGFNICSVIGVRKNSVAELYIFFMIKDKESSLPLLAKYANLLKFK